MKFEYDVVQASSESLLHVNDGTLHALGSISTEQSTSDVLLDHTMGAETTKDLSKKELKVLTHEDEDVAWNLRYDYEACANLYAKADIEIPTPAAFIKNGLNLEKLGADAQDMSEATSGSVRLFPRLILAPAFPAEDWQNLYNAFNSDLAEQYGNMRPQIRLDFESGIDVFDHWDAAVAPPANTVTTTTMHNGQELGWSLRLVSTKQDLPERSGGA